jgi:hypothetical protein
VHRPDLNSLSASDRTQLADLIQQHATPAIVQQHVNPPPGVHSNGTVFLSWHRSYIAGLEAFIVAQGRPEWSPLPAWDPSNAIPNQFNRPNSGPGALQDLTPNVSFSPDFDEPNLVNFDTDDELGIALIGPHNLVHVRVGGVMGNFQSPSAPIFWPWHSFLDDIWWSWQRLSVAVPDCGGMTLIQARAVLTAVGLLVGATTVQPHLHWPLPFPPDDPLPPFTLHWHPGGGLHLHGRPQPPRRPHRHVVVDQNPEAGRRVRPGVAVDLILGSA